jgi:hypothetical protein
MAFAIAGASYALGLDIVPEAVAAAEQERDEQMKDAPPEISARANFAQGMAPALLACVWLLFILIPCVSSFYMSLR